MSSIFFCIVSHQIFSVLVDIDNIRQCHYICDRQYWLTYVQYLSGCRVFTFFCVYLVYMRIKIVLCLSFMSEYMKLLVQFCHVCKLRKICVQTPAPTHRLYCSRPPAPPGSMRLPRST